MNSQRTIMRYSIKKNPESNRLPSNYFIKPLEIEDKQLAKVLLDSFHRTIDDEGETLKDWENELIGVADEKYGPVIFELSFSMFYQDELIGTFICTMFRGIPLIVYIAIIPKHQGKNLSIALINACLIAASQKSLLAIYLVVTDDNHAAKSIYKKSGFEIVGKNWDEVFNDK